MYANTIKHDYVLDDNIVTQGNSFVQKGFGGIGGIWTHGYLYGFNKQNDQSYRPIVLTIFAIEKQLFNSQLDNPGAHHFFNVVWYGMASVMLFLFLLQLFKGAKKQDSTTTLLALIITLLFAAHPIHTEVVANIKSRDEILSFFFLLLSLYYVLKYAQSEKGSHLGLALLGFLFCVLSKDSGLAMFGLVPFTMYYFTTDDGKEKLAGVIPKKMGIVMGAFSLVVVFYLLLRTAVMDSITFEEDMAPINNSLMAAESTMEFIATNIKIHGKYLTLLLFPHPLSYDYSYPQIPISGFGDWRVLLSLLAYIGLAIYAIRGIFKKDPISYGIVWYVIMMILTSNFITVIGAPMAERFLFTPSFGFCLIMGLLLYRFFGLADLNKTASLGTIIPKANPVFLSILGITLLLYSAKTIQRNSDWKNPESLFTSGLTTADNSARALSSYGTYLREKGEQTRDPNQKEQLLVESISWYEKAIALYPEYSEVHYNMGVAQMNRGKLEEAQKAYEKTLAIEPEFQGALNNIGYLFFSKNDYPNALKYWNQLLEVNPESGDALGNIGAIYHTQGDFANALAYYEKCISFNPTNNTVLGNLVKIYTNQGNTQKAQFYQNMIR